MPTILLSIEYCLMGTPIDDPVIEYGPNCNRCPRQFPAGKTPRYVYAYFEGIENCGRSPNPAPNGQSFTLEQVVGNPCLWNHVGDTWFVEWQPNRFGTEDSLLRLVDRIGWAFFSASEPKCPSDPKVFANDMHGCAGFFAGSEGNGIVTRHTHVINLVQFFGFRNGLDLMWEIRNHPDGDFVHKFCDTYQRTNIRFRW